MESPDPGYLYNADIKPQESLNFELGIKGNRLRPEKEALRRILFEATFFHIKVNNEIVPYEILGDVFFRNAAQTRRLGLEFGTQLEIVRDLNFTLSYTYSNFDYLTYVARTIELDSTGNFVETDRDFTGNIVPSVPEHNLYSSLSYSRPLVRWLNGFAKASYMGISGMWVDDANTDKTDAYHLMNGVLGLDMRFGGFNMMVSGGINNILDVTYVGFTNTNSADGRYYEAGAPRNWFLTVNFGYRF
jgi:iron complex outermembrane receptor protein